MLRFAVLLLAFLLPKHMFLKGKDPVDHTVILAPRLIGLECRVISFVFNNSWTEVSLFRWTASYGKQGD